MEEAGATGPGPTNPFDAMVPTYERWVHPVTSKMAEFVLPRLRLSPGMRLLDVGAGLGNLAVSASARGVRVEAIDSSPVMVAALRARLGAYTQSHAELRSLYDLVPGQTGFDATASLFCAAFMPDASDVIRRLVGMTRPGGVVCVNSWATPFGGPMFEVIYRALKAVGVPDAEPTSPGLLHFCRPDNLRQVLRDAGCSDVQVDTVELACPLPPPQSFLGEFDSLFRIVPAYNAVPTSMKRQLQASVEDHLRPLKLTGGAYRASAVANVAFGTAP